MPDERTVVFTIGHSTRKLTEFISLLEAYGIREVVDVRTIPKSRANPQFNEARLGNSLKRHGIIYKHADGLGGLRHPQKDSVNAYWHNASFRGFADYMQTAEFSKALDSLIKAANERRCVIMCAEAVPWRCHRSLIADALSARGIVVRHIFTASNCRDHRITEAAHMRGKNVTYP